MIFGHLNFFRISDFGFRIFTLNEFGTGNPGMNNIHGRLLIFTGDGKGKTTGALGMALRALGHGQRVLILQLIKANPYSGELAALKTFPGLELLRKEAAISVLTGRGAGPGLMTLADTVTEMRNLKHGLTVGWKAQEGLVSRHSCETSRVFRINDSRRRLFRRYS